MEHQEQEQVTEVKKCTERQRTYYEKNREAWNAYQREYKKRRYKEDPSYRFKTKEYQREQRKKNTEEN